MAEMLPQVYASPTDWNERLISLLSSVAFRRFHQPDFVQAASERLPFSLEVQYPASSATSLATLSATASVSPPVLLIVVSSDDSDTDTTALQFFLETARQSPAFLVLHEAVTNDNHRQMASIAHLCASPTTTSPTFLVLFGNELDTDSLWSELRTNRPIGRRRDGREGPEATEGNTLRGIVSIHLAGVGPRMPQISNRRCPPPDSISFLQMQIGGTNSVVDHLAAPVSSTQHHYGHIQNPNMILITVSHLFPDTLPLWLARVVFRFMFAVLQLSESSSNTLETPGWRRAVSRL